jgi:predicted NUDIX family NTP pyrophosphohydrolase
MPKRSSGLVVWRRRGDAIEILLVHPGGPFWKSKDDGAWSIPKGEYSDTEDPLAAAQREFLEETGIAPAGDFLPLGEVRQAGGKRVTAWAHEGDYDAALMHSNSFELEWPPKSGRRQSFPEVDRFAWFPIEDARRKILSGQTPLLDELASRFPDWLHRP